MEKFTHESEKHQPGKSRLVENTSRQTWSTENSGMLLMVDHRLRSDASTPQKTAPKTPTTSKVYLHWCNRLSNYTSVGLQTTLQTERPTRLKPDAKAMLGSRRPCPHSAAFASMPAAGCMMLCAPSLKKLPTSNFRLLGPLSSSHSRGLCARCRRSPSPPYSLRKGATTTKSKNKDEFRVFSTRGIWHNLPTQARH